MSSSKIQRYGVDYYNLRINNGGTIELDPGPDGSVRIDGDLTVLGTTTTIESQDLVITDNTIILNDGESGVGVSQQTAGISIDRGLVPNVGLFFDETLPFTNPGLTPAQNTNGSFILSESNNDGVPNRNTIGLYTSTINTTNGRDLYFLSNSDFQANFGASGPRLTVFQTTDYERRVFPYTGLGNIEVDPNESDRISRGGRYDDDVIPNIRAVTDFVKAHNERNFQNRLISPGPDGFVSAGQFATSFSEIELSSVDAGDTISKIDFKVNSLIDPVATYFESEIRLFDVRITENAITTSDLDSDLVLSGNGDGYVTLQSPLSFPKTTDPDTPQDGTVIYAKDEADGGTGLFFVNEQGTQDELISRNKALLYSIIF